MNPIENRIEPESDDAPKDWPRIQIGQVVEFIGMRFRVGYINVSRQRITLEAIRNLDKE